MPPPASEDVARPRDSDQISTRSSSYASDTESDDGRGHRTRMRKAKQAIRLISFISANICALCSGSIVVFSLYAPLLQSRLHYTQFQVNAVAIAGSLALYLPISIVGYICDRVGLAPLALTGGVLFGGGYGIAAGVYRKLDLQYRGHGGPRPDGDWSLPLMMFAFVCIGIATCALYMAAVSSCAKNFGKGRYRGLALATPITCFGLSPMWLSQAGSRLFTETRPDGSKGDLDVFRFFLFLAILLFFMGIMGTFTLRVVDEDDLIDEAIEELEQSGLLDGSSLLGRTSSYGGVSAQGDDLENSSLLDPTKDDKKWKKNWVLNAETRQFLADRTMWPFALAFLLMVGPGEAFINNLGTIIGTLTPPMSEGLGHHTSAATHVSIFGVTNTLSRIFIGTLTDLLAPSPQTQHVQVRHARSAVSDRFAISRVAFMAFFAAVLSFGLLVLASGFVQNHSERFWLVSGMVGAGYGAIFSLTPLIVTIIWGVENFATNFGIIGMLPALGSTFWGLVYSAVYQNGANHPGDGESGDGEGDLFCYGQRCYAGTYWAETITVWIGIGLLLWAWKGRRGWVQRGIVI
ncbi:putative transporter MCH1 [Fusarium euwallaceae]|uniref:Probable transporter MCH1 n=2 Tax=Fusarium solani species complex TaxID=232080 RepID=A0A3M2SJN7_9HYPO|nr:putative transporter MCH1 [Fusarium kuroshium]RSL60818.1 putative transporter MCH1 [Fusarium sp. AF-6]RTE74518.1 putative transporter MCH1 [Fusarium euwallaceae]